jgi:uncharacterized protein with ATP-grasp and redox domains
LQNHLLTSPYDGPKPPIPEPLRGLEAGTFAHQTVTVRMPEIARQVLEDNDLPADAQAGIKELLNDIPFTPIRPLRDASAPDADEWVRYIFPYTRQNWLQVPWFFAETYFYRRIIEAIHYFQPGFATQGLDPYIDQKHMGQEASRENIRIISAQIKEWLGHPEKQDEAIQRLLILSLWGNQTDLSIWAADQEERPNHRNAQEQISHLLSNDSYAICRYLSDHIQPKPRVDFILDNTGPELAHDLCLADFLLTSGTTGIIRFHLKNHPTFVSDATIKDVKETIDLFVSEHVAEVREIGNRLKNYLANNRLTLIDNLFWTSPLSFWEIPKRFMKEFSSSDLIISKGDLNYRRLLGDRHWMFTTPISDILSYIPVPLAALRVLKSEIVAGLQTGQPESQDQADPDWLSDGQWGVIQFYNPLKKQD